MSAIVRRAGTALRWLVGFEMNMDIRRVVPVVVAALILTTTAWTTAAETTVVMLGTGTPVPDHLRAGASVAVVYDGRAYLFDLGHGSVRRALEASQRLDIDALAPTNIERVFFTHLHSDHTLDYAQLTSIYWWRRATQIRAWGPSGLTALTAGMHAYLRPDVQTRLSARQPIVNQDAARVIATEITEGPVLAEHGLRVEAFEVSHGGVRPALAYRVTTPDRTIVISGDTTYSSRLATAARDADVLIHEVVSEAGLAGLEDRWRTYHGQAHTRSSDLARLAREARPKLLVLTHVLHYAAPIESALREVTSHYDGRVVLANDLDVY